MGLINQLVTLVTFNQTWLVVFIILKNDGVRQWEG